MRALGAWDGGWRCRAAGPEAVGVLDSVLAAFMNVFGAGPALEMSQNYFGRAANLAALAAHPDTLVFLTRRSVSEGDVRSFHNSEGCAILSTAVERA